MNADVKVRILVKKKGLYYHVKVIEPKSADDLFRDEYEFSLDMTKC